MAEDFDKVFGSNSPLKPYEWSDSDYLEGWNQVGSTPPTVQQFDALQALNDRKTKELKDSIDNLSIGSFPNITVDDDVVPAADTAQIETVVNNIGNRIKAITGEEDWKATPANTLKSINKIGLNILQRGKTYSVGDIAYASALPSWARLECVSAGTTDTIEPDFSTVSSGGVLLSDGGVLWVIDDVRDATPIGMVTGRVYLPAGYVKANGATVARADYPRLVALADKYDLWTDTPATYAGLFGKGDGSTTFVLPNYTGRVKEFVNSDVGKAIEAGLPNITGTVTYISETFATYRTYYEGALIKEYGYVGSGTPLQADNSPSGKLILDASKSNPIYGNSTTVQPPAIGELAVIRY